MGGQLRIEAVFPEVAVEISVSALEEI